LAVAPLQKLQTSLIQKQLVYTTCDPSLISMLNCSLLRPAKRRGGLQEPLGIGNLDGFIAAGGVLFALLTQLLRRRIAASGFRSLSQRK